MLVKATIRGRVFHLARVVPYLIQDAIGRTLDPTQRCGGTDNVLIHRVTLDLLSQDQVFAAGRLFGPDAIVNVSCSRVPVSHPSLIVKRRIGLNEKPPVLSILTPDSALLLKGHDAEQPFRRSSLQSHMVLRAEYSVSKIRRHHLFTREPRVADCEDFRRLLFHKESGDGNGVEYLQDDYRSS